MSYENWQYNKESGTNQVDMRLRFEVVLALMRGLLSPLDVGIDVRYRPQLISQAVVHVCYCDCLDIEIIYYGRDMKSSCDEIDLISNNGLDTDIPINGH